MIATLAVFTLAFYWLLRETDWLRARLLIGTEPPLIRECPWLPGIWLREFKPFGVYCRDFEAPVPLPYTPVKHIGYSVIQSVGAKERSPFPEIYSIPLSLNVAPIVSKKWLDKHWADLEDYHPEVELNIGGVRLKMTIRQPDVLTQVMKAIKLTKSEKKKYALEVA